MLLPPKVAQGVADGSLNVAFRRGKTQAVKPGAEFKTVAGVIRVVSVRAVRPERITQADAVRAGHPDADAVRKRLAGDETWTTYRIELEYAGPDPRWALREAKAVETPLHRLA